MSKLEDVAKACGVSPSTVTRAFHDNTDVSTSKREEILKTAGKMNYRPRTYKKKTSRFSANPKVAFVADCSTYPRIFEALDDTLNNDGVSLILANTNDNPQMEIRKINLLKDYVDGFFIIPSFSEEVYNIEYFKNLSRKKPVIIMERDIGLDKVTTICFDLYEENYKAVNLLIQNGHREIAFISNIIANKQNTDKILAYQNALRNNDIPVRGDYIIYCDRDEAKIKQQIIELITSHPELTAILTTNRKTTSVLMLALAELHLKPGENIAVIANHNSKAYIPSLIPITAVETEHSSIGELGAHEMYHMLTGKRSAKNATNNIRIKPTLIIRGSESFPKEPVRKMKTLPWLKK